MKQLLKNYLKDPLSTIAVNTTIFIAGCLFFGTIAFIGLVSGIIRNIKNPPTDIRQQHIQQHFDEQGADSPHECERGRAHPEGLLVAEDVVEVAWKEAAQQRRG